MMRGILKKIAPLHRYYLEQKFSKTSFSQDAEDVYIDRFFRKKNSGSYLDVGAYHPLKFSNTYRYYKKGWNGIVIDANPDVKQIFEKIRPRDIFIQSGISDKVGEMIFFKFEEGAYNTFDSEKAKMLIKSGKRLKDEVTIKVNRLDSILEALQIRSIDFISIDVEGFDFICLQSFEINKYNPYIVLIEADNVKNKEKIMSYLVERGYVCLTQLGNSLVFKKNQI
jgi:FkbM family methyltransferase